MLFLFASLLPALAQAAIFGVDDRLPLVPTSPHYELGRATAVGVLSTISEEIAPGRLKIDSSPATDFLCQDEKFSADPYIGWACTGFLVGPDLLVTAGHCGVNTGTVRNEKKNYCESYNWLFDYHSPLPAAGHPKENLYHCREIIYAVKEEVAPFRDFALIRLDRPVPGRTPLKLAAGPLENNETPWMIGYPLGMPAKISPASPLLLNDLTRESFVTGLDSFEGNSGSPVFNRANEVVGILIGGTPSASLVKRNGRKCDNYNRCRADGTHCELPDTNEDISLFPSFQRTGSEVQRIQPVELLLRALERKEKRKCSTSSKLAH